jgi:hypothetical protein
VRETPTAPVVEPEEHGPGQGAARREREHARRERAADPRGDVVELGLRTRAHERARPRRGGEQEVRRRVGRVVRAGDDGAELAPPACVVVLELEGF